MQHPSSCAIGRAQVADLGVWSIRRLTNMDNFLDTDWCSLYVLPGSPEKLMPSHSSPYRDTVETAVFVHWLRTGKRAGAEALIDLVERKFNHDHDERGRFASGPGATCR